MDWERGRRPMGHRSAAGGLCPHVPCAHDPRVLWSAAFRMWTHNSRAAFNGSLSPHILERNTVLRKLSFPSVHAVGLT